MPAGQAHEAGARHQCFVAPDPPTAAEEHGQRRFRDQTSGYTQVSQLARQIVVAQYQPSLSGHAAADPRAQDQAESDLGSVARAPVGFGKRKALAVVCHDHAAPELRDEILPQWPSGRRKVGSQGATGSLIDESRQPDTEIDRAAGARIEPAHLADDAVQKLFVSRARRFDAPPLERVERIVEQASLDLAAADVHSAKQRARLGRLRFTRLHVRHYRWVLRRPTARCPVWASTQWTAMPRPSSCCTSTGSTSVSVTMTLTLRMSQMRWRLGVPNFDESANTTTRSLARIMAAFFCASSSLNVLSPNRRSMESAPRKNVSKCNSARKRSMKRPPTVMES